MTKCKELDVIEDFLYGLFEKRKQKCRSTDRHSQYLKAFYFFK